MKCVTINLLLMVTGVFAAEEQEGNAAGLEALFGTDMESEQFEMKEQGPTMEVLDQMLQKEKQQLKLMEKAGAEASEHLHQKTQLSQRERASLMMEERLRTTMKAKVRAMVERIGEDERMILKGQTAKDTVDATSGEMTLPAMGERGGLPANLTGDPHWDPDCAVMFFHGLGHGRKDKKIEDVFFRTDAFRYQKPVSRLVSKCAAEGHKDYDEDCQDEYEVLGEVDRCIILLPDAPVTKHSANGDHPTTSWFNQPMLGHGADYLPPSHGVDFDEANRHTPKIHAIIDDLIENYNFQGEKIFLAGFSQGATVAAMAALSYPKSLGGLAMFSGMLLGKENLVKMTHAANREIPISWGYTLDDDVYLPSLHDEGTALLASTGFKIRSMKYPGLHYMTQKSFDHLGALMQQRLRYMDDVGFITKRFGHDPAKLEENLPYFHYM